MENFRMMEFWGKEFMTLGEHKLGPISPVISKKEVIPIKTKKWQLFLRRAPLSTPPLFLTDFFFTKNIFGTKIFVWPTYCWQKLLIPKFFLYKIFFWRFFCIFFLTKISLGPTFLGAIIFLNEFFGINLFDIVFCTTYFWKRKIYWPNHFRQNQVF